MYILCRNLHIASESNGISIDVFRYASDKKEHALRVFYGQKSKKAVR